MRPPAAWPRHVIMIVVSFLMLIPFYWVLKTSLTGENIYAYPPRLVPAEPHLFNYVDVWYLIPFPRYLLNSVIVSAMAIAGSLLFNVAAGYALTKDFPARRWVVLLLLSCMLIPFQATIIPAYLITSWLGVLDTWLGIALPLLSTIICIFIFKASFEAVPRSLELPTPTALDSFYARLARTDARSVDAIADRLRLFRVPAVLGQDGGRDRD